MKKRQVVKNHHGRVPPTLLIILDGFGLASPNNPGNAITPKTAPYIFSVMKKYPFTRLMAHGSAVGLFPTQEGNSEAGHMNIGAGRIVEQDLVRITRAIEDGTFFKNEAFDQALFHVQKYKSAVHVIGLLTNGQSAHANPEHLYALLEYFRKKKYPNIFLHLFIDGRDSPPHSAVEHIRELRKHMKNGEKIASVIGRFYAMDRGKHWERIQDAYDMMVRGRGSCRAESAEEAIAQTYNRGETDEYICPTVIVKKGKPVATIRDNDAIYFFNARSDRARELTKVFVQPDFQKKNSGAFRRIGLPKNIRFVAMTDFGPDLPGIFTAFPSPDIPNCLAKAIGENRKQLYISETEKYAHVTYFLNGGYAAPINGEDRVLVASTGDASYADRPEMKANELTGRVIDAFTKQGYDFVVVNFPNADMVGHTGNFKAGQTAIRVLDREVKTLAQMILKSDGVMIVTADHGNAEEMIDRKTGEMMTEHTTNFVPLILVGNLCRGWRLKRGGKLADVTPTLLKILGIKKPKEMTGRALF